MHNPANNNLQAGLDLYGVCTDSLPEEADDVVTESNVVRVNEYLSILKQVSADIFSLLGEHCGPNAKYAAIPKTTQHGLIHEFTKDGITVVDQLRYDNPISESLRHLVTYMGGRVDRVCHDGTTSAMMLLAGIILHHCDFKNNNINYTKAFKQLAKIIDDEKLTVDEFANILNISNKDARHIVAYSQAMTSSKGNKAMAEALAKLTANMPVEKMFGSYYLSTDPTEGELGYTYEEDDSDIKFEILSNSSIFNAELNTKYINNSVDLLVSENSFIEPYPMWSNLRNHLVNTTEHLKHILDPSHPKPDGELKLDRDLVIIANEIDSSIIKLSEYINELTRMINLPNIRDRKVVVLPMSLAKMRSTVYYLYATLYLAGKDNISSYRTLDEALIRDVRVEINRSSIKIWNLYTKTDDLIHPAINTHVEGDTSSLHYKLYEEIYNVLDNNLNTHNKVINEFEERMFLDIYLYLLTQRRGTVKLTGSSHDVVTHHADLKDAYGAVISSIEDGFVLGGISKWWLALGKPTQAAADLIIYNALEDIMQCIYGKHMDDAANVFEYLNGADKLAHVLLDTNDDTDYVRTITKDTFDKDKSMLLQPAVGYYEIVRRLEELVPKLLNTSSYLAPSDKLT